MNTWDDIKSYITEKFGKPKEHKNNYTNERFMEIRIDLKDGRSQTMLVGEVPRLGKNWVQILSPVGKIPKHNLEEALELTYKKKCGGLVKIGDLYYVRHSTPIHDLNEDEFLGAFEYVADSADTLEKEFLLEDKR